MQLTVRDTATQLGISRSRVHQLMKTGKLRAANSKPKGAKRFHPMFETSEIARYAEGTGMFATPEMTNGSGATRIEPIDVDALQKRLRITLDEGETVRKQADALSQSVAPTNTSGIRTRLARIEAKVDNIADRQHAQHR